MLQITIVWNQKYDLGKGGKKHGSKDASATVGNCTIVVYKKMSSLSLYGTQTNSQKKKKKNVWFILKVYV